MNPIKLVQVFGDQGIWPPGFPFGRRAAMALALAAVCCSVMPAICATPLSVLSVTASSNDGDVPANTLDGSLSTRWSADGLGQWICYALGSSQKIDSINIAWY